jgi:hypothetical protein
LLIPGKGLHVELAIYILKPDHASCRKIKLSVAELIFKREESSNG